MMNRLTLTSWTCCNMERFNKEDIISDWPREDGTSFQNFILFRVYLYELKTYNHPYLEVCWVDDDKRAFNPNAWLRAKIHLN